MKKTIIILVIIPFLVAGISIVSTIINLKQEEFSSTASDFKSTKSKQEAKIKKYIPFCFSWDIPGLGFLIPGIVMLKIHKKKKARCTSKTYGEIVDVIKVTPPADYAYWQPIIEYKIGDSKFIEQSHSSSKYPTNFTVGEKVEIYYNPENYDDFYIVGHTDYSCAGKFCTIIGASIIIISTLILFLINYLNN